MNTFTLRTFFTVLFSLLGSLAFGAATYTENFTAYANRDESFKFGYLYQQAVIVSTGGITGKTVRVGPLSNPASPAIFQTGWVKLTGNNTISFDHKVNGMSSSPVLNVTLVDINSAVSTLTGGTIAYTNANVRNTTLSLGASRIGWYKIRFAFSGTGGSTIALLDNITSNINAASVTSSSTKLADLGITTSLDKATYTVGQTATMTINVVSAGPDVAESAKMALNVPSGMTVENVAFNNVSGSYDALNQVITFSNINNGVSGTVTVSAKAVTAGNYNFGATTAGFPFMTDQTDANNSSINSTKIENVVLPVEFAHFSGKNAQEGVNLTWKTAMEKNAAQFNVMFSKDGKSFSLVGTVPAVGNSTTLQVYSFIHAERISAEGYYQIVEVDFDGSKTYSPKIVVTPSAALTSGNVSVTAYPNPAQDVINLTIEGEQLAGSLMLYSSSGVAQAVHFDDLGSKNYRADLSHLPTGAYYVMVPGSRAVKIIKN